MISEIMGKMSKEVGAVSYGLRVFPASKLSTCSPRYTPSAKLAELAQNVGFWVVCCDVATGDDSGTSSGLTKVSYPLDKPVEVVDATGATLLLAMTGRDLRVLEGRSCDVFLDATGQDALVVRSKQKGLASAEVIAEAMELACEILSVAPGRGASVDAKVAASASASGSLDSIRLTLGSRQSPYLDLRAWIDPQTFRSTWGKTKAYARLSQPTSIASTKTAPRAPEGKTPGEKKTVSIPDGGGVGGGVVRLKGRKTGKCKWFSTKKGYGFILPDEGDDDIFVHQTCIKAHGFRSLAEGERVEFDVEVDSNGRKKARNVTGPAGGFVKGAPQQYYTGRQRNFPARGGRARRGSGGRGGAWRGGRGARGQRAGGFMQQVMGGMMGPPGGALPLGYSIQLRPYNSGQSNQGQRSAQQQQGRSASVPAGSSGSSPPMQMGGYQGGFLPQTAYQPAYGSQSYGQGFEGYPPPSLPFGYPQQYIQPTSPLQVMTGQFQNMSFQDQQRQQTARATPSTQSGYYGAATPAGSQPQAQAGAARNAAGRQAQVDGVGTAMAPGENKL